MRPEIESHAIAGQHARTAVVQAHLDGLRRDEPACTHDQLGAAGLVILEVHGNQADDHVALARQNSLHVGGDGTGHHSEPSRVVNQIGDLCAPNLVLAGKTVGVWARAADQFTLDNGGAMPRPGQVPSQEFAPRRCRGRAFHSVPVGASSIPQVWLSPQLGGFGSSRTVNGYQAGRCPAHACTQTRERHSRSKTGLANLVLNIPS